MTQRDVAKAMDWSTSKVIRIENGDVGVSVSDLRSLLGHYEVDDPARIEEYVNAARSARSENPWAPYRNVHSPGFIDYLAYENAAKDLREFEAALMPGLLQTEEYAKATLHYVYRIPSQEDIDRRWDARAKRQEIHERERPPRMHFVLDEAVVSRHVGGTTTMRHQLERLLDWMDMDHIEVRIIPFTVGAHPGMKEPFTLLGFTDDDDVLNLEQGMASTTIRDDPGETAPYADRFDYLESLALSPEKSRSLVKTTIDRMKKDTADTARSGRAEKG
jgi:transcriptional regulator with XRE-family HTH domain